MVYNAVNSTGLFVVADRNSTENEQEKFLRNPERHLCRVFGGCLGSVVHGTPSHLVMFDDLIPKLSTFLVVHGYEVKARFLHNIIERSEVVILAR
jgi:hypothetical protein